MGTPITKDNVDALLGTTDRDMATFWAAWKLLHEHKATTVYLSDSKGRSLLNTPDATAHFYVWDSSAYVGSHAHLLPIHHLHIVMQSVPQIAPGYWFSELRFVEGQSYGDWRACVSRDGSPDCGAIATRPDLAILKAAFHARREFCKTPK